MIDQSLTHQHVCSDMFHFGLDFGSDTANSSRNISEGFGLVPKIFKMTNAGRTGRGWFPLPDLEFMSGTAN